MLAFREGEEYNQRVGATGARREGNRMVSCQDLVVVKNKAGAIVALKSYERLYFTADSKDETETVDVTSEGSIVGQKVRPAGTTKADPNGLFSAALAHLQKTFPSQNPILALLSLAEDKLDLAARGIVRQAAEAEIEGPAKVIERAAKALQIAVPGLSAEAARQRVVEERQKAGLPV